jgi:hypothetical protein
MDSSEFGWLSSAVMSVKDRMTKYQGDREEEAEKIRVLEEVALEVDADKSFLIFYIINLLNLLKLTFSLIINL